MPKVQRQFGFREVVAVQAPDYSTQSMLANANLNRLILQMRCVFTHYPRITISSAPVEPKLNALKFKSF